MHSRYPGGRDIFESPPQRSPEPSRHPQPVAKRPEAPARRRSSSLFGGGSDGRGIGGLLKSIKIDWDAGDILLILIMLFLLLESDDEEILIMLALVLFMGL